MFLILGMTCYLLSCILAYSFDLYFCSVVLEDQLLLLKLVLLLVLAVGMQGHDLACFPFPSWRLIVEWVMNLREF